MGRNRIPGASRSDRGGRHRPASIGLHVVDRGGTWYISGTLRIGEHSRRVRKSTGLPARADTHADADALRHQVEGEIRAEVVHGIRPSRPLGVAADLWLRAERPRPLGAREIKIIQQATALLGTRWLDRITDAEWHGLIEVHCAGRSVTTRRRWLNGLLPFLKWCTAPPRAWLPRMPAIERPKLPSRRRHATRRRVVDLTPELIALMFDHAAPHLRAQLWTAWSTGARVSSLLWGCRLCDLQLAEGREHITFHDTKNGEPVVAHLHPLAAQALREYLDVRKGLERREGPLFLDHNHLPYSDRGRGERGGQTKTALAGMRRRTIRTLLRAAVRARRAGDLDAWRARRDQARLVRQVTPHWLRHALATNLLAMGADLRSIMDQAGWRDPASVMVYSHDVPEVRRTWINGLGGASLTQPASTRRNSAS